MIKLLIADDEALVCIGLQSMLKWEQFNIQIVGVANNGGQAEEMIGSLQPDIVISDIKMPIKSGLDVAVSVRKKQGRLPVFIFLTSYEEFEYAKIAISIQAAAYLVKLDLTPKTLSDAINESIRMLGEQKKLEEAPRSLTYNSPQAQQDRFFVRLLNNLFENKKQYELQKNSLRMELAEPAYTVCICRIIGPSTVPSRGDKLVALCSSTVQMVKNTLTASRDCYVVGLDLRHFAIITPISEATTTEWQQTFKQQLTHMTSVLHNYFNVEIIGAVGNAVEDPYLLRESYVAARRALPCSISSSTFVFYEEDIHAGKAAELFDFSQWRPQLRRAFEEVDTQALHAIISNLLDTFEDRPDLLVSAIDASCHLLFMTTSLLSNGESIVEQIFDKEPEGYRAIYQMQHIEDVLGWLVQFRDGCCEMLSSRKQSYKEQLVGNVQEYIKQHLDQKLTLNHVADVFNFSPNYLSHLFSKIAKINFVEYITETRIAAAKEMINRGEGPIYEISQKLGFESAFYFSRVFKKVEGISPREYVQRVDLKEHQRTK